MNIPFNITRLNKEKFEAKLNTVVRYWNDADQRAQADNQASDKLKESCKYIFLRDDGWSIASPDYEAAFKLWPRSWSHIYMINDPERTGTDRQIKEKTERILIELPPREGQRSRWTGTKSEFMKMMDRQSDASGQIISDADPGL